MTTKTPLTHDQKLTIKQLVDDGEVDAARKLLVKWGDAETLAKINAHHPVAKSPVPIPVMIVTPGANYRRVRNFVLFVLLIILVIGVIYLIGRLPERRR